MKPNTFRERLDKLESVEHLVTVIGSESDAECRCGYANFSEKSYKNAVKYVNSWRDEQLLTLLSELEGVVRSSPEPVVNVLLPEGKNLILGYRLSTSDILNIIKAKRESLE